MTTAGLPALKPRELIRAIEHAGFRLFRKPRGSHWQFEHPDGMIGDERKAEGGRLVDNRRIQVPTAEGHTWLGESRFQRIQVEDAGSAT